MTPRLIGWLEISCFDVFQHLLVEFGRPHASLEVKAMPVTRVALAQSLMHGNLEHTPSLLAPPEIDAGERRWRSHLWLVVSNPDPLIVLTSNVASHS